MEQKLSDQTKGVSAPEGVGASQACLISLCLTARICRRDIGTLICEKVSKIDTTGGRFNQMRRRNNQKHGFCRSLVKRHSQDLELCCSSQKKTQESLVGSNSMSWSNNEPVRAQSVVCVQE